MSGAQPIHAELIAVLVAVASRAPRILTMLDGSVLPAGPLETGHRSLQAGLRRWVASQTGHAPGHIEQIYTFADTDRNRAGRSISIAYLGLTTETRAPLGGRVSWRSWYDYFPWEDRRIAPDLIETIIEPGLQRWITSEKRRSRAARCFAFDGMVWNETLTLARYELLYEAGMVSEAVRDGRTSSGALVPGSTMSGDHRRILATAISRLRAKIKQRPIVFELLPEQFTLLDLQRCVEALAGNTLHNGNFRRLVESQSLLEPTGNLTTGQGRPARLYRYSADSLAEHLIR